MFWTVVAIWTRCNGTASRYNPSPAGLDAYRGILPALLCVTQSTQPIALHSSFTLRAASGARLNYTLARRI